MRVVFMGTPDIAAKCLDKIISDRFDVVAVYTQPDRPKNRGMKLAYSPVKEVALANNLAIFQPENFRDEETVRQLRDLKPDVVAVVAYGRILPQSVLDIPAKGCINIHASLLPKYRGSAPYQWAVLNGDQETGVSAMYLSAQMDAGDVIDTAKTPIDPDETAGQLLDRLAILGADLLSKTLSDMEKGKVTAVAQNPDEVTYAPMLDKSICPLDYTKPAQQLHNQVRGLNPWPVATTQIQGNRFKVYQTACIPSEHMHQPGTILGLTKTGLQIACAKDILEIRILQAEGGKRMAAPDYFRGHPLEA